MDTTLFLSILSQRWTTDLFPILIYRGDSHWNDGLWIQNLQGHLQEKHWKASVHLLLMIPEKQWSLVQKKKQAVETPLAAPFIAESWHFCPWLESCQLQEEKYGGFHVAYRYRFFGSRSSV